MNNETTHNLNKNYTGEIKMSFTVNLDVPSLQPTSALSRIRVSRETNAQAKELVCEGLELLLKREASTLTATQATLIREMLAES